MGINKFFMESKEITDNQIKSPSELIIKKLEYDNVITLNQLKSEKDSKIQNISNKNNV